jgi:hypothetical protein
MHKVAKSLLNIIAGYLAVFHSAVYLHPNVPYDMMINNVAASKPHMLTNVGRESRHAEANWVTSFMLINLLRLIHIESFALPTRQRSSRGARLPSENR